jgi:hypothetical protein
MHGTEHEEPRPDIIEPTTPQESPAHQTPSEAPPAQPDEVGPAEPDKVQPDSVPSEVPNIPGNSEPRG